MMKTVFSLVLFFCWSAFASVGMAADKALVVVELFTSQGCSSCPPADKILRELSDEPHIIALAHHVDYWNYLGWKDPFSSRSASDRQRRYARVLSNWTAYTPQMVIDGRHDVAGYKRSAIREHIQHSRTEQDVRALVIEESRDGAQARVVLPRLADDDVVWRIDYDALHETDVERGENGGRQLVNAHVVRQMQRVDKATRALGVVVIDKQMLQEQKRGGSVVLIQRGRVGPIRAAGHIRLKDTAEHVSLP